MDYTDLHFRQMSRLLSKRTWLWTEMVVDNTIIHTDQLDKFLWFPPEQHPIVLQLGGSDPATLRQAAKMASVYGYDEVGNPAAKQCKMSLQEFCAATSPDGSIDQPHACRST